MDRRRAAGALLALAACIATTAAAPTASNQTALDLYDEPTEGCYYNFQHYGEGDRIMTNEPCLNCTCHNRMLMCYLRVCPFTKAIGQDCTVEKRADQCCPIVTCPDVPVDLLTSTSTSSPAEYGGTGVGKVDKYGCSINGKYFSEGAKVPQTLGKPCEHCYCIRNMTTCVMQECTLHVDGCTPIYHKDVCCPVRYFCDHTEDEIPLLDDMTTTVRPTQGFLLTTTAPTEAPTTMAPPARRDCTEDDQLYADGALIKTDKPCEHCYCMKGDIVCVVQECGTPMENEGKNCTSLPPREGQCCPDTYICEGDELSTDVPMTEMPFEEAITTVVPPRRVSVEGSGYRNEPDEIPYTEVPTFATDLEGSGEEELAEKPEKETPEKDLTDKFGPTEEAEFIPLTTQVPIKEEATTEPDNGLNTVPSGVLEKEITEPSLTEITTMSNIAFTGTEPTRQDEQATTPKIASEEEKSSEPSLVMETTPIFDAKATEPSVAEEKTTETSVVPKKEIPTSTEKETTPKEEDEVIEPSVISEPEDITVKPEEEIITEISTTREPSPSETTKLPSVSEKDIAHAEEVSGASFEPTEPGHEAQTTITPLIEEGEQPITDTRRTTSDLESVTSPKSDEEEKTEASVSKYTTPLDDVTEPAISEQNTVPVSAEEEQSSEAPALEQTTMRDESEPSSTAKQESATTKKLEEEISEPSIYEKTTVKSDIEASKVPVYVPTDELKEEEQSITTEPTYKREEEEVTTPVGIISDKELVSSTVSIVDIAKETMSPSDMTASTEKISTNEPEEHEKTSPLSEQQEEKEVTTESIMELSTFAHVSDKESATTLIPESETAPTVAATEKIELPEMTTIINTGDNEITEVPSPGRIPGEGDCLLESTTYKNDSIVPSSNKCHSGCKCVSSIIKCDPIICSPPPEDMDNCQPRYDTPEACCPTYVCDHGMETIPPQPQSHITGTESPTPSTIECHGDVCEKTEEKQPPTIPPQTPEHVVTSDCGSSGCDQAVQSPAEPCTDNKCEVQPPTELEQPQEIPINRIPQSCANSEDCKETSPIPCEGESCTTGEGELCNIEGGCIAKPDAIPHPETPQVCANEEECKQVKVPEPASACDGESCTSVQEDCTTGECKVSSPQPSQQDEKCSEESGCKILEEAAKCENDKCENDLTAVQCTGDECMLQQPITPTQETGYTESMNTESPSSEQMISRLPTLEEEVQPVLPELPTTLSEEAVTTGPSISIEPDKEIKITETPASEEENQVTETPDEIFTTRIPEVTQPESEAIDTEHKVTETSSEKVTVAGESVTKAPLELITTTFKTYETESPESTTTETSPQSEVEVKPIEKITEQPEQITESQKVHTDKPDEFIEKGTEGSTEVTKDQYDETKSTELPEFPILEVEDGTKAPERDEEEQEHITMGPESSVTGLETIKPEEEPVITSTESRVPEIVTMKLSEETTRLPEKSEPGVEATEPSIQEEQTTRKPEMSTISEDFERKTEASSSTMHEDETTPSYGKETESAETPTVHVTEPQADITKIPKEDFDKLTTYIPERSDVEAQDETTTPVSDVTQTVSSAETKFPELEAKYTTTEILTHSTISDEYKPTEPIPVEQEKVPEPAIIGLQTTISPEKIEIETSTQQAESEEPTTVEEKEKVTTIATTIPEEEKETESSLFQVTKQPQTDVTTVSAVKEHDEIPELSSTKPQDEEKMQEPESYETKETVSPSEAETTKAPQQPVTEKETSVTDQEKLITESPTSAVTEAAEPSIIEQELSTKTPQIPEAAIVTEASYETEAPEILEKTTGMPSQPVISEAELEKVTEAREPAITEEYEISTEEPEQEDHHTLITEIVPIEPEEMVTKEAELSVTETTHTHEITETSEETEKEKSTEMPVSEVERESTEIPEITENVQTESPVSVTEHQEIPERIPEEKDTTESSVFEEEKTEIPAEFITKQTFTESPQLHETTTQEEIIQVELTTVAQHLVDTEIQKTSSEQPLPESPEDQKIEKEEAPVTNIPEQPVEGAMTELPEVQHTATAQPEPASPEISEVTTISPKIQETESEDKHTEQPVSVMTELQTPSTAVPQEQTTAGIDRTGPEQDDMHKKEHETIPEELPESPVETSTTISVSEEDKQKLPEEPVQTTRPEEEYSETMPYSVELEEHTHKMDTDETTNVPSDEFVSSEEPGVTSPGELLFAPSEEPTIVQSEGSTIAPSEEPTVPSSEESTIGPLGEYTVGPLGKPTFASSEEPDIVQLGESTVAPSGEANIDLSEATIAPSEVPTVVSAEEPIVSSSEQPIVSSSEEPTVVLPGEPTVVLPGEPTVGLSDEPTTAKTEMQPTEPHATEATTEKVSSEEIQTQLPEIVKERPSDQKEEAPLATEVPQTTVLLEETPEKSTESVVIKETTSETMKPTLVDKYGGSEEFIEKEDAPTTPKQVIEEEITTAPSVETEKPTSPAEAEKEVTVKPQYIPVETTAPEEEFIPVTTKATTAKAEEEAPTESPQSKPEEKPIELPTSTTVPEISKPDEMQPVDEVPSPEDESHFPPSGGYNQEPDYVEEDQAFGPGTCRYGGKVYVSAQQIPRDDPCDFCFCFRSDIICLQQSCPPPIHGCHEEPIQGFCCPRYECPVSMASTLNVTTTTTTTTTTLPPHFLPHAYKGAVTRKGCQIKGHTYQVGEVVRASSGPCLHCTCGGDGQMKCDPKQCTPEPMLRQMIAAAVSAKRRR